MSDAASSVGGDFGCCKGEAGSVAASPVVQLREALAARDDLPFDVACHIFDAGLADAAQAALAWMEGEPERLQRAWDEGEHEGFYAGAREPYRNPYQRNPYRREGEEKRS